MSKNSDGWFRSTVAIPDGWRRGIAYDINGLAYRAIEKDGQCVDFELFGVDPVAIERPHTPTDFEPAE